MSVVKLGYEVILDENIRDSMFPVVIVVTVADI